MQRDLHLVIAAAAVSLLSAAAMAHPGGLDANGCHTNHKTGDYHCHRPAAPGADPPATASDCPCGSGKICIGPRGGRFCITPSGTKRYGQ